MPRRKPGTLLPLEIDILGAALRLREDGEEAIHGFGLAQTLRDRNGSRALTAHGTLYKALGRLEERGLLSSRWEDPAVAEGRPRRRLYALTADGARIAGETRAQGESTGAPPSRERLAEARMTPERIATVVSFWARLYTRRLPEQDARRRIDELRADLHDHIAHERAHGTGERWIAGSLGARMLRGMPADLSWRHETSRRRLTQEDHAMRSTHSVRRSVTRVAVVTVLLLLIPLTLMLVGEGTDWGAFDFIFAGALIAGAGLLIEIAMRSRGTAAYAAAAVAGTLGIAAIVAGEADDAPGLVGFGLLLVLGMVALTVRNVQRSQ